MSGTREKLKNRVMGSTIAVAMLAALGWSYGRLLDSRAAAAAAAQDLADCRALAGRIESLRHRPAVAGVRELAAADLSQKIESAAHAAEFADGSIERIEPEPARRVGDRNYREVATQVRLKRVTLKQMFTFLHALCVEPSAKNGMSSSGLQLRDLRLASPRGEETGERWTVESTLTYRIYSPKTREEGGDVPRDSLSASSLQD